ncbi:MAG: GNAT family N-acetyltransferase [Bosea sp. (in: a-proteobacteria)]|nr:GNAT family N-acetyltransferase [Bosea sp. (in: a-proteobacteria)]
MRAAASITIERASPRDAGEIAALYLASRTEALPYLRRCHSDDEVRGWILAVMLASGETWVAREAGRILGFATLNCEELDQLYLLPGHFRRSIGSLLLAKVKERSRNGSACSLSSGTPAPGPSTSAMVSTSSISTTAAAMKRASRTRFTRGGILLRPGTCNRGRPSPSRAHDDVEDVPQSSVAVEDGHEPNV